MVSMTSTARGMVVATLVVPVLTTGLSGCGLLDGGSRLEEALEYLPTRTEAVTFVDRAKAAERLGLDDVDADSSEEELEDYAETMSEAGLSTFLTSRTATMADGAAFTDLDVEWEASAATADAGGHLLKMADELDLDEVGDALAEAGYDESGSADVREFTYSADDLDQSYVIADYYPANMLEVAIVPDEHLMILGGWEEIIDAVTDDDDSMADDGGFHDLVDEADDLDALESAVLLTGDATCARGDAGFRRGDLLDLDRLGRPVSSAYFDAGPDRTRRAVLLFETEDEAAADAEVRTEVTDIFEDLASAEGDYEVEADGEIVTVSIDDETNVDSLHTQVRVGDGPLACGVEE